MTAWNVCPTCGESGDNPCRNPGGTTTMAHSARPRRPVRRAPGHAEREALHRAVVTAVRAEQTLPCSDSVAWISEDFDVRELAAELCAPCPILGACAAAGRFEETGVWGGKDRTPTKRGRPVLGPAQPESASESASEGAA